jgi:hypothetical protein
MVSYIQDEQDIQEERLEDKIDKGMPKIFAKSADISIQRELQSQPNVSENIKIETTLNLKENIARNEITETFKREGAILDKKRKIEYIISNNSKTYSYPRMKVSNSARIPFARIDKISEISGKSELNDSNSIKSTKSDLIDFSGYDITKYTSSEEFEKVTYNIKTGKNNRIESYNMTAETDSENIKLSVQYYYSNHNIKLVIPNSMDESIRYPHQLDNPNVEITSMSSGEKISFELRNGIIELSTQENFGNADFEIISINSTQKSVVREHFISKNFVIKFMQNSN